MPSSTIVVSDGDKKRIEKVVNTIGKKNVECIQLDASDYSKLVSTLKTLDLAVGLAPGRIGYKTVKVCVAN